ncbi:MAG: aldo/keto reductase [Myxococcaceae bacterium]|nr:aldo/keto reductase [Myxococcaceae bacterium]
MMQRSFGATGMQVSELGLGCARIGGIFKNDPAAFVDLLCAARDRGINFFDTADMYSQGESEVLLGRAFRRRRAQVVIASKVGYCLPAQRRLVAAVKPFVRPLIRLLRIKRESLPSAVRGALEQNFSPAYIQAAVEASLRRLRTDYLDVLQLHSPPAEIVERGEWARAIESLKRAGKVRHFGISCDNLEAADAALKVADIASIQVVVNLLEQSFAQAIVPRARQRQVAVIARECLANGLLVKPEQDVDVASYCSSPEQAAVRKTELSSLRTTASARGAPLSRLALEYVTGLEGVSVALVGVSRMDQLTTTLRDFGR